MTKNEEREHAKLLRKWALGTASMGELMRCHDLDRKAKAEAEAKRQPVTAP